MASKRKKPAQNFRADEDGGDLKKATKLDYAVAKHLFQKLCPRLGDLHRMEVKCFYGEDAVNCLLDSHWAKCKEPLFTDRQSCVSFCNSLLYKELFHRAVLMKRKKPKTVTAGETKAAIEGNDTPAESGTETKSGKKKKEKKSSKEEPMEKEALESTAKPKKVKKLKLDMCDRQYFSDGKEIFVWIYEPVSWTSFVIGLLIVGGAIAMCLYPLWPPEVRSGVYYLSILGAGFLGVIISLAILRYVVYGIVLALTFGKHKFFLFPNLTEDCGFFESFVPLYSYSQAGEETTAPIDNKKSSKQKTKSSTASTPEAKEMPPSEVTAADDEPQKSDSDEGSNEGDDFELIQAEDIKND